MTIAFTQARQPHHQIAVCDEQERYFVEAETWGLGEVADAFLNNYGVQDDDDGSPVRFWIEYVEGSDIGTGVIAQFEGFPNGRARQVG